ncbi:signal peptidase [Chryseobacterium sp. Y16C]|uniref:signal peptidase n=1 Tax=Chryseobacterium sp. Y16C TaxID=2920939 RepID=UPI001F0A58F1|nr:signal peptidase [Chryseobacterium sp. Y16C]UMQ40036.1 signal peptidase [Chryseobacterium sp. Y16C]
MKKSILRFLSFTYLLFSGLLFAENEVPTPPTARPGGTGGDTGTPGAQASPIDMYVYVLAIVAILTIVYFAKKYKSQKI